MAKIKIGYGLECTVYDVGNGRCYKKYVCSDDVDCAYQNAKLAFEAGIAPEVYERDKNGYYTETVEVFGYLCDDCQKQFSCFDGFCNRIFNIIGHQKYQELCDTICELFGKNAVFDLHIGNIGRKNGKLVAIDFGTESGF